MSWDWSKPEAWSAAGTVAAVIVAIWAARRWRADRRAERRAEAAQEAVKCVVAAAEVMHELCYFPAWLKLDISRAAARERVRTPAEEADAIERAHEKRDDVAAASENELARAYARAVIHLEEPELIPLRLMLRHLQTIRKQTREYAARVIYAIPEEKELQEKLNLEWPTTIHCAKAEALRVLVPIARYRSAFILRLARWIRGILAG